MTRLLSNSSRINVNARFYAKGLATVFVTLALVACESSDDTPDTAMPGSEVQTITDRLDFPGLTVHGLAGQPADQVITPWVVNISGFQSNSFPLFGDMSVRTLEYSPLSVQDEVNFRVEELELETCMIENNDSSNNNTGSNPPPYVSGGQSVTINTPSGPWLTIDIGTDLRYVKDNLPGPWPTDASLSIPGDVFPTVGAYPLVKPQLPVRLTPEPNADFDVNAVYSWEPSNNPSSSMVMDFIEYDSNGNFAGFPAYCNVLDDGEFVLPPEISSALAANPNTVEVRYARNNRRMDYIDGVLFFQGFLLAE